MIALNTLLLQMVTLFVRKMPQSQKRYGLSFLRRIAKLIQFGQPVPIKIGVGKVYLDLTEYFQARMAVRTYETELEDLVNKTLQEDDSYLDIGAQLGYTALLAINQIGPNGKAILIDADPRAIRGLKKMVRSIPKQLRPKVKVVEKVCSDRDGQKLEFELLDVVGHSKVTTGVEERRIKKIEIETVTIDTLTKNLKKPIRLVKMDVEGHEVSVLKGMVETLSQGRIEILVMENNPSLLKRALQSPRDLFVIMTHFGYYGYSMEQNAPIGKASIESDQLANWVFCLSKDDIPESIREKVVAETLNFKKQNNLEAKFSYLLSPAPPWNKALMEAMSFVRHDEMGKGLYLLEKLLQEFPDAHGARGHYAHWLLSQNRKPEAASQYAELVRRVPTNKEAKDLLSNLTR